MDWSAPATTLDLRGDFPGAPLLSLHDSAGPGPALLLIHGLGDESDSFRHVVGPLAALHRVMVPDLPGFGASVARRRVTFAYTVRSLRALADRLIGPGTRLILVGSSLGAALAQALAMAEPERCAALVLEDGGIPGPPPAAAGALLNLLPCIGEAGYRAYRGRPEAAFQSLEPYYANLAALPEADREFLKTRVVARVESELQLRAYFSLLRSYAWTVASRGRAFRDFLVREAPPTLVLWGKEDRILPASGAGALAALVPGARVALVAEAGHLPHQEAPRAFLEEVGRFLESAQRR